MVMLAITEMNWLDEIESWYQICGEQRYYSCKHMLYLICKLKKLVASKGGIDTFDTEQLWKLETAHLAFDQVMNCFTGFTDIGVNMEWVFHTNKKTIENIQRKLESKIKLELINISMN